MASQRHAEPVRYATRRAALPAVDRTTLVVGGLTALAFVLRVVPLQQSLFGDELFTYDLVHGHGLIHAVDTVQSGVEDNPPLFYVLAWLAAQLGDQTVLIRLPSVLAGTATVPLVFVLGRATVGRRAGMLAALLLAIAPFACFYGTEARAYALLGFFSALTTILLLRGSTSAGRWWWAFTLASAGMLYTHYTGALVLCAQLVWVFWRRRDVIAPFLLAAAGAVVLYVPWLPTELGKSARLFTVLGPLHGSAVWRNATGVFPGHPLISLSRLPGALPAALALVGAATAVLWRVSTLVHRRERLPDPMALLVPLAIVAPLGVLAYSLLEHNIFLARNMMVSVPALALLLSCSIVSLPRLGSWLAGGVIVAALAFGAVQMLRPPYQRPPYRQAADFVEQRYRPGDSVLDFSFRPLSDPLARAAAIYLPGKAIYEAALDESRAWRRAARGGGVFMIVPQVGKLRGIPPRAGPRNLDLTLVSGRVYPGLTDIAALEYRRPGAR